MSTVRATSRVQEIRNRTDAIQQKNAKKTQGTANAGQSSAGAVKSTAKASNTDTVSISMRSNSSSYAGQYKDMSDESLDKTINNLKNTIKNSKSGTATYYAQKALEGYQAEKEKRSLSTMLTGSHSENLESYLRDLEKQYGTQYVCDKVFGGNKSKYDPVKRAEQICGINGGRVSDAAMKNRVDEVVNGYKNKLRYTSLSLPNESNCGGALYWTTFDVGKNFNWDHSSTQYKISLHWGDTIYGDDNGYARVNNTELDSDPYLVALGSYYGHKAFELGVGDENGYGAVFKITYESGKHIYVTMGDSKADEDTDEKNMYALGGIYGDKYNNLLEFIYSTKSELSDYRDGNAVSVTGQEKIIDIAVVNDVSIKW